MHGIDVKGQRTINGNGVENNRVLRISRRVFEEMAWERGNRDHSPNIEVT